MAYNLHEFASSYKCVPTELLNFPLYAILSIPIRTDYSQLILSLFNVQRRKADTEEN